MLKKSRTFVTPFFIVVVMIVCICSFYAVEMQKKSHNIEDLDEVREMRMRNLYAY